MMKGMTILLLATALFATPVTYGDVITLPQASNDSEKTLNISMPQRGMTMEMVTSEYGEPAQKDSPVGTPPIIRWEYDKFAVYFESKYVIHSVMKK